MPRATASERMKLTPRLRRLAPALGPALAALAVFPEALFGGRVFFDRDISAFWLPHIATFVRVVAEGSWPLWNPYEGFGLPLLADPSVQVAYPLTWLNLLLPAAAVYKIVLIGHVMLAGAGVAALGRRFGLSPLAAGLAGTMWSASGPLLSAGSLHQHLCGAAWMPWVLLALESALDAPGARAAARLAAAAAAQALTGSADMCLLTAVAAAGRLAFFRSREVNSRSLSSWGGSPAPPDPPRSRRTNPPSGASLRAATLAGAAVLAFSIAAVQWIPSAALLGSVERGRLEPAQILYWSVHPLSLVDLVVPRFFADLPLSPEARGALFEGREPFLTSLYVGLTALPLLALAGGRGAGPRAYAFTMAAVFGVAALGRHVPLVSWILTAPPFSLSRYPAKYMLPFALFWALLAGFGLDAWRRPWAAPERRRALLALALMGLLAAAALAGGYWAGRDVRPAMRLLRVPAEFPAEATYLLTTKLDRTAALAVAAALILVLRLRREGAAAPLAVATALLVAVDLASAGRGVNPVAPSDLLAHRPRTLELIGPDVADHRLLSPTMDIAWLNAHFVRGVAGWDRRSSWVLGMKDILAAPIGARWGLRGSYDSDVTGLATPEFHFMAGAMRRNQATPVATKLLRMGNVGYAVSVQDVPSPGLAEVGRVQTVFDRPVRVSRVVDALPPAWVVGGSRAAASPTEALLTIAEPGFDPAAEVVLAADGPRVAGHPGFRGACTIVERRADRLVVDVEASANGHLVVAEGYEDGWRAWLDGAPARVLSANVIFRAVAVPPGRHRVEMRYRPASVTWGAALSAAAVVATVALRLRRER